MTAKSWTLRCDDCFSGAGGCNQEVVVVAFEALRFQVLQHLLLMQKRLNLKPSGGVRGRGATSAVAFQRDIASYAETELEAYLERSGNDVKTIYRSTRDSWTGYLRHAGLIEGCSPLETVLRGKIEELSDAEEKKLLGRMAALIHVDDPERAAAYSMLVGSRRTSLRRSWHARASFRAHAFLHAVG